MYVYINICVSIVHLCLKYGTSSGDHLIMKADKSLLVPRSRLDTGEQPLMQFTKLRKNYLVSKKCRASESTESGLLNAWCYNRTHQRVQNTQLHIVHTIYTDIDEYATG